MIEKIPYSVDINLLDEAISKLPHDEFRFSLNKPTGNFFYDDWIIKSEFKNTVWEEIYNSLPKNKGEARIIKLSGGESYISHADIDDRYHLNLSGSKSFLIDLDNNQLHPLIKDGIWYEMNAGIRHSASNFGNIFRYQLVVRKLLTRGDISNRISVTIKPKPITDEDSARFIFDDTLSPWLNTVNKNGMLDEFTFTNGIVSFVIEGSLVAQLKETLPSDFELIIK
jgi:hypothetical protein